MKNTITKALVLLMFTGLIIAFVCVQSGMLADPVQSGSNGGVLPASLPDSTFQDSPAQFTNDMFIGNQATHTEIKAAPDTSLRRIMSSSKSMMIFEDKSSLDSIADLLHEKYYSDTVNIHR